MKIGRMAIVLIHIFFLICLAGVVTIPAQAEEITTTNLTDFDIFEADIRDVYRSLAELGDVNILLDPIIKGQVTIKLKPGITVKEAIELLSQINGYSYRWISKSRTAIIGNGKTFQNFETAETQIYKLNYAEPNQVTAALTVIVPKDRIGVDKRTNQLTIKASVLEHQNIEELINRLDREMPQINIEARIEEVSRKASKDLGVSWGWTQAQSSLNFKMTTTATLVALEEKNMARLIANPNISTTDSQEGKIFLGDKLPIVTSSQTDKGVTYSVSYIEVGTTLTVTPRINENDTVTVIIQAGVSDISSWKKSGDTDIPVIRTREASSVVRLREGETFVLSGLNYTNEVENKSGIPGVAKIPLLGRLFQKTKTGENQDTELCIFLTPTVVKPKNWVNENTKKTTIIENKPEIKEETKTVVPSTTIPPTVTNDITNQTPDTPITQVNNDATKDDATKPIVTSEPVKPEVTTAPDLATVSVPPTNLDSPPIALSQAPNPGETLVAPPQTAPTEATPGALSNPVPKTSTEEINTNPTELALALGLKVRQIVKKGNTLITIAKKYGVTVESIQKENNLKPGAILTEGQSLVIPIPKDHLYQLKPKETLWRIAKRYGTTIEILKEINKITDVSNLEIGQIIILPTVIDKIVDKSF